MYRDVYERDTSRYIQDTCRIYAGYTGYVSYRKLPPKRIGNPTSPDKARRYYASATPRVAVGRFDAGCLRVLPVQCSLR